MPAVQRLIRRARRPGPLVAVSVAYLALVSGIMIWRGISVSPDYLLLILVPVALVSGRFFAFLRDWVPFVALFLLVYGTVSLLYIEIMPRSFDAIQALTGRIHADFIANFARPGIFSELESGFIFHYRERGADGSLKGVFIQDRRDPQQI